MKCHIFLDAASSSEFVPKQSPEPRNSSGCFYCNGGSGRWSFAGLQLGWHNLVGTFLPDNQHKTFAAFTLGGTDEPLQSVWQLSRVTRNRTKI